MSITSLTNSTAASASSSSASTTGNSTITEGDFMQLLVAQMQNQDPLSPADSTEMASELAQFTQVQLQQTMSTQLGSLLVGDAAGNEIMAASLAGKSIQYGTSSITLAGTTPVTLNASLSAPASSVTWTITDQNGNVIQTLTSANQPAGPISIPWNGLSSSGNTVPQGTYNLAASATGPGGSVQVNLQGTGTVSSVTYQNGYPQLVVNGQNIGMSNLIQIYSGSAPSSAGVPAPPPPPATPSH